MRARRSGGDGAATAGRPDGSCPVGAPVGAAGRVEDQIRRIRLMLFALGEAADGVERAVLAAELGRGLSWMDAAFGRAVEPVVAGSMGGEVRRQLQQERHELRRQLAAVRRRARRLGARATADPGFRRLVDDLGVLAAGHLARLEDEVLGPWRALRRPEREAIPIAFRAAPMPGAPGVADGPGPGHAGGLGALPQWPA